MPGGGVNLVRGLGHGCRYTALRGTWCGPCICGVELTSSCDLMRVVHSMECDGLGALCSFVRLFAQISRRCRCWLWYGTG